MTQHSSYFRRKLYILLTLADCPNALIQALPLWGNEYPQLQAWWNIYGKCLEDIARSSDRVGLTQHSDLPTPIETRHLISGEPQTIENPPKIDWQTFLDKMPTDSPKTAFLWLWRFYPAELARIDSNNRTMLLYPADRTIPDCPHHSYITTVTAIAGAMFPDDESAYGSGEPDRVHILLFSFSPVQEFIKASRKFVDFWAGSYLLHYLSAQLCWSLAEDLGADAIIIPSLWNQEVIDALLGKHYASDFREDLKHYAHDRQTPQERFAAKTSTSLVTAGFPNAITAIVPGRRAAEIAEGLEQKLREHWQQIAKQVRDTIRTNMREFLGEPKYRSRVNAIVEALAQAEGIDASSSLEGIKENPNRRDLRLLTDNDSNWQWAHLWDAQIDHTWEPYWTAIPLGDSKQRSEIEAQTDPDAIEHWIQAQDEIAPPMPGRETLTAAETALYGKLNIGTWWSNVQARTRHALQAIKNDRSWQIPPAPGLRSTLSGQFSAVHPFLNYRTIRIDGRDRDFREGAGINSGSMRLFWRLMEEVFPGLFNGSEMLNALELTKRMAWAYGGLANELGVEAFIRDDLQPIEIPAEEPSGFSDLDPSETIDESSETQQIDYEKLIRFPNLSSIAAARFIQKQFDLKDDDPTRSNIVARYWRFLSNAIVQKANGESHTFTYLQRRSFYRKTRRPTQCPKTDRATDTSEAVKRFYNGTMFSARWLADDMSLDPVSLDPSDRLGRLRQMVDESHRAAGFKDGSPSDWWAIVLADGDGMGQYVAGTKLKGYEHYIVPNAVSEENRQSEHWPDLLKTQKRMTPATHVGLNRALLDFSNRLVPYITEHRYCGRVVYSGGDDVMAIVPLEDLPGFLRSLRAAWCGDPDPEEEFNTTANGNDPDNLTGYWHPRAERFEGREGAAAIEMRPHFTMGKGATMSAGIVIANKAVPLPTVLNNLWEAESQDAKRFEEKNGLCFRIAYANGNVLKAPMKGTLLDDWWDFVVKPMQDASSRENTLSPLLYRLSQELPDRAWFTENRIGLFSKAAQVIAARRDTNLDEDVKHGLVSWVERWETWVSETDRYAHQSRDRNLKENPIPVGCRAEDLSAILRFTAFWLDKVAQRNDWHAYDPNGDRHQSDADGQPTSGENAA